MHIYLEFLYTMNMKWNEIKRPTGNSTKILFLYLSVGQCQCNAMLCIFAFSALDLVTMWTNGTWCHWEIVVASKPLNIQCIRLIFWIPSKLHQQFTDIPFTVLCCAQYRTILICYALILYLIKLQIRRCFALMRKIPFCHVKMNGWRKKVTFTPTKIDLWYICSTHSLSVWIHFCLKFVCSHWKLFSREEICG